MSSSTDPYFIALAVLQKITCVLSATGSLMIISQVSRSKFNRRKPQQRLMLGMSAIDFQTSIVWAFTNFFMPSESGSGFGNQASCSAQGFLVQFSTAGILYMCALQLQYLLTIKYRWKERTIRKIEPYMHAYCLTFGLVTAAVALGLNLYGPADWDCWIAEGDNADIYRWAFFFGPLWASIAFCLFVMLMVIKFVHHTETKGLRWSAKKIGKQTLSKEVRTQCLMYAGSFFIVWTFPTISRLIQLCGGTVHPVLVVLSGTFIAIQGFFNALIYFRPRYRRCDEPKAWRRVWILMHTTLFFCFCNERDYTRDTKDWEDDTKHHDTGFTKRTTSVEGSMDMSRPLELPSSSEAEHGLDNFGEEEESYEEDKWSENNDSMNHSRDFMKRTTSIEGSMEMCRPLELPSPSEAEQGLDNFGEEEGFYEEDKWVEYNDSQNHSDDSTKRSTSSIGGSMEISRPLELPSSEPQ